VEHGHYIAALATVATAFGQSSFATNTMGIFYDHLMGTVLKQLDAKAPIVEYTPAVGPTVVQAAAGWSLTAILNSLIKPAVIAGQGTSQVISTFNQPVQANNPILLDPFVAFGYRFETGPGDPNFASVGLPFLDPSQGPYGLYVFTNGQFEFLANLDPLTEFSSRKVAELVRLKSS